MWRVGLLYPRGPRRCSGSLSELLTKEEEEERPLMEVFPNARHHEYCIVYIAIPSSLKDQLAKVNPSAFSPSSPKESRQ